MVDKALNLESIKVKIDAINENVRQQRAKLLEEVKGLFGHACKELFELHPELDSLKWQQYTPYFNDGEECTFSANVRYCVINDNEDIEYSASDYRKKNNGGVFSTEDLELQKLIPALKSVRAVLNNIDEDMYKEMFGDHVEVRVSRNGGVEVTEYDHD